MRWTVVALVVLGVVAALCAALLVASLQASGRKAVTTEDGQPREVEILVATRDLPAVAVVDAGSVATRTVKVEDVPPGALTSPVKVIGQVLVAPMVEGQVFTATLLASNWPGTHLAATLPEGMRAVSVVLSNASALGGWLYAGALVDVVAVVRVPNERGGSSTEILSTVLLQGIEVLAVNTQSIVSTDDAFEKVKETSRQTVTLMVDAKQAESLELAAVHGDIALALRNPLDTTATVERGVYLSELSGTLEEKSAAVTDAHGPLTPPIEGVPGVLPPRTGPAAYVFDDGSPEADDQGPTWRMLVIRGTKRQVYEFTESQPY
jgi:Flp pilus assembly protein CpaB